MVKALKIFCAGLIMAFIKRSILIVVANYGKKIDFSEIASQILDTKELSLETLFLVSIYYIFEWFLKKF